jgi:hypothetical protein
MYTCELSCADVVVDGKPYQVGSIKALRAITDRLMGKQGVRFPNYPKTQKRLEAVEKAARESKPARRPRTADRRIL